MDEQKAGRQIHRYRSQIAKLKGELAKAIEDRDCAREARDFNASLYEGLKAARPEEKANIHGSSSCEEMESMYHKVVMVALECDPIPACDRADDRIEAPWEVFARIKRERDLWRQNAFDFETQLLAALPSPRGTCGSAAKDGE